MGEKTKWVDITTWEPQRVRVETRQGTVRAKKGQGTPSVELELGAKERLLDFVISPEMGSHLLASAQERLDFEKRKTIDWEWEATVAVYLPVPDKNRSTGNRAKKVSKP